MMISKESTTAAMTRHARGEAREEAMETAREEAKSTEEATRRLQETMKPSYPLAGAAPGHTKRQSSCALATPS